MLIFSNDDNFLNKNVELKVQIISTWKEIVMKGNLQVKLKHIEILFSSMTKDTNSEY